MSEEEYGTVIVIIDGEEVELGKLHISRYDALREFIDKMRRESGLATHNI